MSDKISIIRRQTNYSDDVIKHKLELYNENIEAIILEYVRNCGEPISNFVQESGSTNQKIFRAIRENFNRIRRVE